MTEDTYCDNCGVVLTTGNTVVYASLPYDVESAWAGESGQVCVGCDADLSSIDEGCGKWGCKECYPGEEEGV